jgi:hypothetical protein
MTWASDTRNQPLNASHVGRMDNHQGNGFSVLWNAPTRQTVSSCRRSADRPGAWPPERVSPPSLTLSSTCPVLSSPRSGSTASCSLPPPLHYLSTAIGESPRGPLSPPGGPLSRPGGPLSRPGRGSAPLLPRMGLATSGANPDWYLWPDWLPLRIITRSSTTSGRRSAQPGTRQSPAPSMLVQPPHG